MGACENPKYIAFLSAGAMLPRYSLDFGLASISPTEKTAIAETSNQAALSPPTMMSPAESRNVPTAMLFTAFMRADMPATKKQVNMMMNEFRLKRPAGLIASPSSVSPIMKCATGFCVPSGPNSVVTIVLVSIQSLMCRGNTSKKEYSMNQKPENRRT